MQERSADTVHLLWNGIKVSVFVLPHLGRHVEDRHLDVTGILATKLHAILDRGLRRDFFDLYVMLQQHRLGHRRVPWPRSAASTRDRSTTGCCCAR